MFYTVSSGYFCRAFKRLWSARKTFCFPKLQRNVVFVVTCCQTLFEKQENTFQKVENWPAVAAGNEFFLNSLYRAAAVITDKSLLFYPVFLQSHLLSVEWVLLFFVSLSLCFCSPAAESFSSKGKYLKRIRYHGRGMFGIMDRVYCHYFVKLVEGSPPKKEEKTSFDQAREYVQNLKNRTIIHSLWRVLFTVYLCLSFDTCK